MYRGKDTHYESYYYNNGDRYDGEWKNGRRHGKGVLIFAKGGRYDGDWENGKRHGKGFRVYSNGDRYDGDYLRGKKHGKGVRSFSGGSKYEGEYKDGKKSGKGVYSWPDGGRYDGDWWNGIMNGKGTRTYHNGNRYDGEYKDGKLHGKGIYFFANGDRYDGEFRDDIRNGKGVCSYSNGNKYEGEWKNDRFSKGIFSFCNGDRYDGEYKEGKMHGKGVRTYSNGSYVGEYKAGNRNGKGIRYYSTGERYEGEYKAGKKNGRGVQYFPSGSRFEGYYKDGKKHGKGVFFFSSGDRHEGEYLNGISKSFTFFSSAGERGVFEMVGGRIGTGKAVFEKNGERIERVFKKGKIIIENMTLFKKKDNEPQKKPQGRGAKRKRVKNKPQKEVLCFKFPRTTLEFRDSDTSDFVIKSYQRSKKDFKTTKLTFIDSEDMDNPRRKEYLLSENNNTKLRDLKMAIRRTYVIAPFTISRIDQPLPSENDENDKLKIFLDKNQLGNYYSSFVSSGVNYEDLTIFVEDENAVDDFIQMIFHKRKFLKAIKIEFNC